MRTSLLFKASTIIIALSAMFVWVKFLDKLLELVIHQQKAVESTLTASTFLFACIVAPLWEELAFRHLPAKISTIINPKLLWPVLILSCIIFGFGHGYGVKSLMYQGVLGLGFTWVYVINKNNYWLAVLTHCIWNLICFKIAQVQLFVY